MVTNALLTASIIVFIFTITDIMLDEKEKCKIEYFVVRVWSRLDDCKTAQYLDIMRNAFFQLCVFLSGSIYPLWTTLHTNSDRFDVKYDSFFAIVLLLTLYLVVPLVSIAMLRWSLQRSWRILVGRMILSCTVMLFLLPYFMLWLVDILPPPVPPPYRFPTDFGMKGLVVHSLILESSSIIFIVIFLPLVFAHIVRIVLFVGEFIVRRIAEYPKGIILVGSAISSAALGIFKALA
jgi:hypothetical protein